MNRLQIRPSVSTYVEQEAASNSRNVSRLRTLSALFGGVAAGILGITGWLGLVFFIVHSFVTSMMIFNRCNKALPLYFANGNKEILSFSAQLSGALTYILAWTVVYDAIYIF